MYKTYFKRCIDFCCALIVFICLLPVFITLSIILFFTHGKKGIFFFQERPGKNGKIFKIIKFKTMNEKKDASGKLLPDLMRVTKIGNFIREYSLDELPQLLNVIKGDMSLIGPRPLLVEYLQLYSQEQAHRHDVRPGITGWAQINGRNTLTWTEKFKLDTWYVEHLSFFLDIKIAFLTLKNVFSHTNIINENVKGNITTPNFDGTN